MPNLLILGPTPAQLSTRLRKPYTHAVWTNLATVLQSYLLSVPDAIPVTALNLGWEQIAAEVAQRLDRPFICYGIPPNKRPNKSWLSPDKMTFINAVAAAAEIHHGIWPISKIDSILTLHNGGNNTLARKLNSASIAQIPIINLWPEFISLEQTQCQ